MGGTTKILESLRLFMKDPKYCPNNITAYIVTSSDAHNSEYTADCDKRREYICKFNGSAGTCVVTNDKALLWTDGRYFLQANDQLDENWTLMKSGNPNVPTLSEWLTTQLPNGSVIGVDPLFVPYGLWKKLSKELSQSMKKLVAVESNLVDLVWAQENKTDMPYSKIYDYPIEYAGVTWEDKIKGVREKMMKEKADILLISTLDAISWLFNLRGSDVDNCPVFKSYASVSSDTIDLFVHTEKLSNKVLQHLTSEDPTMKINIHKYHEIKDYTKLLAESDKKIWMNSVSPAAFTLGFKKTNIINKPCPVDIMKSIKNKVEQTGIKQACLRDSAALCQYFGFLEDEVHKRELTEITGAKHLLEIRQKMDKFVDLSFPTISSSGANSAIIHYHPDNSPNPVIIDPNNIYLCDSGGQYWDGTTDITRTLHYGIPTEREILTYTTVLKGHINLARSVFPENTKGHSLDVNARISLWSIGLDYLHGTGHGIGCFLNVHEGPQCISLRAVEDYGLKDGMLLSNEPGYYEDGKFGIRIENMMFVKEKTDIANNFNGMKFLTFETVSLIPMQQNLINPLLLTFEEIEWLNSYHKECVDKVGPILDKHNMTQGLRWLKKHTEPIYHHQ